MILAIDVHYHADSASAAGISFESWTDGMPTNAFTASIRDIADYEPGQFYKRELPCMLALLNVVDIPIDLLVIDGYVYLSDNQQPGLGHYLYSALEEQIPVIGVAKNAFRQMTTCGMAYRGKSSKPLYVTSVGIELAVATDLIQQMHGPYRIPTLLKMADTLARDSEHEL